MARIEKECIVNELSRTIKSSSGVFLLKFKKFSAQNTDKLRRALSEVGSEYHVVKNKFFHIALEKTELKQLQKIVDGPTAAAFVSKDIGLTAKKLHEFCKDHEGLEFAGGWYAGRLLKISEVEAIATLPPRPVLLAKVVGGISAPIYGLVNVLKGNLTALMLVLESIKKKKT